MPAYEQLCTARSTHFVASSARSSASWQIFCAARSISDCCAVLAPTRLQSIRRSARAHDQRVSLTGVSCRQQTVMQAQLCSGAQPTAWCWVQVHHLLVQVVDERLIVLKHLRSSSRRAASVRWDSASSVCVCASCASRADT